jgi:hypothetical protein
MTMDSYYAMSTGLLHSEVFIELPRRRLSRIIPGNRPLQANIYWNQQSIEDDLYSKVTQIMNKDTIVFGRDHYLEQWGVQRFGIRNGGKN